MDAYLDIETTWSRTISVIGVYRPDRGTIQLIGAGVSDINLYAALAGVRTIWTFNGACFDLPVIKRALGADLRSEFAHRDLLRDCRRRQLRGGLKVVEQKLGIVRSTAGIDGRAALRLWQAYDTYGDVHARDLLLRYNRDDVIHLPHLRAHLEGTPAAALNPDHVIWSTSDAALVAEKDTPAC